MTITMVRKLAVGAIGAHSVVLGICMCSAPRATLQLVGWVIDPETSRFFLSQSGVFLIIMGAAYAYGVVSRPFAWFLVGSKAGALLFLLIAYLTAIAPLIILVTGLLDSFMGALVAFLLVREPRAPAATGQALDPAL